MEIVQSANSNDLQFEDIDSSDDGSTFNDSYQFDDDDMESSDDASIRSASKRYSKAQDGIASPDKKVIKSVSKRKLASMSSSTDEDDNPTRNEGKNASAKEEYVKNRKRKSSVGDQSQETEERYSKRGHDAPSSRKTKYDASIERRQRKRKYSQEEPNREVELQRSHSADPEGRSLSSDHEGMTRKSDDDGGIKEQKSGVDTATEKEPKGEKEIRSAREQLRQLYRKNKESKGDEGTTTEKEFRWEDEVLSERDQEDGELQDEGRSKKLRRDEEGSRSAKKYRDESDGRSSREHRDEGGMRSSREYRNEGDDRSARRREEEYRRNRIETEEERYRIRDKRYVDYGDARDRHEERRRRSFVERYHEGGNREGKPRHHSWHPDRGQSDIDVRPRRGDGGYPRVDRRSEGSWYRDQPRLLIKPCDYFNSLGSCRHRSGHRSKSGARAILHICRSCFYSRRRKEYHSERDCHLKE